MFGGPSQPSTEELNLYRQMARNTIRQAVYTAVALWAGKSDS